MSSSWKDQEREFSEDCREDSDEMHSKSDDKDTQEKETGDRPQHEHFPKPDSDQVDLNIILDAVLDINNTLNTEQHGTTFIADEYSADCDIVYSSISPKRRLHSKREMPHRRETRRNFSFRNEQVLAIDTENQRLLREISRPRPSSAVSVRNRKVKTSAHEPARVQTSSEVNRKRFQKKIDEENQALLRRLEAVKPTKSLNREHLLRSQSWSDRKGKNQPRSACSRSSSQSKMLGYHAQDDSSEKLSRTRFSKPVWEAGW